MSERFNSGKRVFMLLANFIERLRFDCKKFRFKGFLYDFILTVGTNLLLMTLSLLSGSMMARILGPEGRGELAAIRNWAHFLVQFGALGLPFALTYFVGRNSSKGPEFIVTVWGILLPLSLFWMALCYLLLPYLLAAQNVQVILEARIYLLIIPLGFIGMVYAALQGWKEFEIWNLLRLMELALYILVLVAAWLFGARNSSFVARGFAITRIVAPLIMIKVATKHGLNWQTRPDWSKARPLLSYGLRSFLGMMPERLNRTLDQLMIAAFLPARQVGLYAIALSWSSILSPILNALSTVVFPHLSSASPELARDNFLRSMRLAVLLVLILSGPLIAVTRIGISVVFGESYVTSANAAMILIVAMAFWHLSAVMSSGLRGIGHPEATAWPQIIGLGVFGILLIFLVRKYEIIGVAVASLVSYCISFLILIYFCLRWFNVSLKDMLLPTSVDICKARELIGNIGFIYSDKKAGRK